jgi:hypothetical protein
MRVLMSLVLCLGLYACGGSNNDSPPANKAPASINNGISPNDLTLDTPPTDGKLPNDLIPPV